MWPLQTLRLPNQAAYEQRYAPTFGRFRLPLITRAASAFRLYGDWSQGITRIRCPGCGFDWFRIGRQQVVDLREPLLLQELPPLGRGSTPPRE